jgi:hypothetical protein
MTKILVIAFLVTAVLILLRVIIGTPLIQRVAESFQSGGSASHLLNSSTECPKGSELYMYDGVAYCCGNGKINRDADDVQKSCRPITVGKKPMFCTLGPSRDGINNCLELRAGYLEAEAQKVCPPSKPNYAQGSVGSPTEHGRCCKGPVTADGSNCADASNVMNFCNVSTDTNEFKTMENCQIQREKETAESCPEKYSPFTMESKQGPTAGLYLYGCTDGGSMCYSKALINRLKELGYDSTGLKQC